jgi:branched-chain amino acid transport system permease protein
MIALPRALATMRRPALSGILLVAALAFLVGSTAGPSLLIDSIVLGTLWALVAAGLTLVFGVMNVANFAQGAMFMVGTLVAFYTYTFLVALAAQNAWLEVLVPPLVIVTASAASAVVGLIVDRALLVPLRRNAGADWIMSTFAITIGLSVFLTNLHQIVFGSQSKGIVGYFPQFAPMHVAGLVISPDRAFAFAVGVCALVALGALLSRSRLGRAMRAVAQDEIGARLVGIPVARIHALTFALGSAMSGLAGGALLFLFPSSPHVGQAPLYLAWMIVIIAGLGNVAGTVLAGMVIALLNNATAYILGATWTSLVPFAVLMALLIARPSGLFGRGASGVWER